jgi:hypothetical protein
VTLPGCYFINFHTDVEHLIPIRLGLYPSEIPKIMWQWPPTKIVGADDCPQKPGYAGEVCPKTNRYFILFAINRKTEYDKNHPLLLFVGFCKSDI